MLHLDEMHEPAKTSRRTFRDGENQLHMFLSPNVEFRLPVCT